MSFLPFGVQYYRAPTPEKDQWNKDLKKIRDSGFNVIKIWAQWRWNNPAEGEYYFDDLDELMNLSYEYGLKVIINTIFDAAPAWFFDKFPESVMVACNGKRIEPRATSCRQIGGAPGPCYHHDAGTHYRMLFLETIVQRYSNHPALYIWDLWNEPALSGGVDVQPGQDNMCCYCPTSIEKFRLWLKGKYATLENLNCKWGRNYRKWGEVEPPHTSRVFNDMIDWRLFFADTLTNELKIRKEAVKSLDITHPVMVHTIPLPYADMINTCSDDYFMANECDLFGNSVGSHPFAAALSTSAAPGKKVINSEIHAIAGSTYNRPRIPSFEEMKKHIMIPLARGIKGFLFWQYRPEILGSEAPAWGLTTLDGGQTSWFDDSIRINQALQQHKDFLVDAQPMQADIAIINGKKNQIFDWCVADSIERHYYSVYGVFMALYHNNYNIDIISTDQVDGSYLKKYKVVYYPFPYYIEERVALELKEWIRQGGTLISEAFFGSISDVNGLHSYRIPGCGFDEIFGVSEGKVLTASNFTNTNAKGHIESNNNTLPFKIAVNDFANIQKEEKVEGYFFHEELIPNHACVLAHFEDDSAAVTYSGYGNGKAIMIGTLPGYVYGMWQNEKTGHFLAELAKFGGARPYVKTAHEKIRVDILRDRSNKYMLVVNNDDECEKEVELILFADLNHMKKISNIINHREYELTRSKDGWSCIIPLRPYCCEAYIIE